MSKLSDATERLQAAVARLELAAEAQLRDGAGREELQSELATAQAENERLRRTNADISGRLDAAIDRLKTVLEA